MVHLRQQNTLENTVTRNDLVVNDTLIQLAVGNASLDKSLDFGIYGNRRRFK